MILKNAYQRPNAVALIAINVSARLHCPIMQRHFCFLLTGNTEWTNIALTVGSEIHEMIK